MSERDFVLYVHAVSYFIVGHVGVARDLYMENEEAIRRAARFLLQEISPGICYRGIVLDGKHSKSTHDRERSFISFTEDLRVAQHFSDLGPDGFGFGPFGMGAPEFVQRGRGVGHIAEYRPSPEEMFFHHDLFKNPHLREVFDQMFDRINNLAEKGSLGRTFIHQKEVVLFNQGQLFELTPFKADESYVAYAADWWKKANPCPSCGEDAAKCPCDG